MLSTLRRHARLRLEYLEDRCVPADISMNVSYNTGKSITISGQLTNHADPGFQMISIGGVALGTALTDQNGNYSITLEADELGDVTVQAMDESTDVEQFTLTDVAIGLYSFTGVEGTNRFWTFTGTASYSRSFDSITILFGGFPVTLDGQSTTTNSSGVFEFVIQLNGDNSDNGFAWAKAQSPWGTLTSPQYYNVLQTGT